MHPSLQWELLGNISTTTFKKQKKNKKKTKNKKTKTKQEEIRKKGRK